MEINITVEELKELLKSIVNISVSAPQLDEETIHRMIIPVLDHYEQLRK